MDFERKYEKYKQKYTLLKSKVDLLKNQKGGVVEYIIRKIYSKEEGNLQHVFSPYITGGGTSAISQLFSIGGASRCVMEAFVPYVQASTDDKITKHYEDSVTPEIASYSSEQVSYLLADASLRTSVELFLKNTNSFNKLADANIFGIASTSTIRSSPSDDPTTPYNCFACTIIPTTIDNINNTNNTNIDGKIINVKLTLSNAFDRSEHEKYVSRLVINLLNNACFNNNFNETLEYIKKDLDTERISFNSLDDRFYSNNDINTKITMINSPIIDILDDKIKMCLILQNNKFFTDIELPKGTFVVPGSFNPIHKGHYDMVMAASKKYYINNTLVKLQEKLKKRKIQLSEHNENINVLEDKTLVRYQEEISKLETTIETEKLNLPLIVFEIAINNADKDLFKNSSPELQDKVFELIKSINIFNELINVEEFKTYKEFIESNDYKTFIASEDYKKFIASEDYKIFIASEEYKILIEEELNRRIENIHEDMPYIDENFSYAICITKASLFVNKTDIFKNTIFVVGYDTFIRIVNPFYYNGEIGLNIALNKIKNRGCSFIIGGRKENETFKVFDEEYWKTNNNIIEVNKDIFKGLTEEEFSNPLSSTQLRENNVIFVEV
jgi:hypothetical protein